MGYHADGDLSSLGREEPFIEACHRTTGRVGKLLLDRTVEHTPVAKPPPSVDLAEWIRSRRGRQPGTLKESWKVGEVEVLDAGRAYSVDVFTNDRIAPYVEWPTLPHIIVPRRPGGMLRFWDKLGRTVYATIVHHTGTKGSYMLTTALAEVAVEWQLIAAEELERWAREQRMLF